MQITISSIVKCLTIPIVLMGWVGCDWRKEADLGSNLNVAVSVEIASLDPQTTHSIDAIKIQSALFETLVRIDAETGAIEPAGALHWEILDNGCTYRFELNPLVKWSDGRPVTASDYVFSFRRIMNSKLGAPFAPLYFCIRGAQYVNENQDADPSSLGVLALSENRLEIRLDQPVPYFLSLLARPCVAALPEQTLIQRGAVTSRTVGWSLEPGFPTSGPYQLQDWEVNKHILVCKNPTYYRNQDITFDTIHFYSIESAYAQEQGFLSGALDVTSKLSSERVHHFQNSADFVSQLEMGTFYVIANTESDALRSSEARRALSGAIDREAIVLQLRKRGETPATTFSPPLWRNYHPQNGVSDGSTPSLPLWPEGAGKKLKLLISSSEGNLQITEALQAMWSEKLGLDVEIVRQEWKSYLDSRKRGNFDLCLATWIGDYFDPLTFLEMWKSDAPNNFSRWHDEKFDGLLNTADAVVKPAARFELLEQAEQELLREAPILPLFYLSRVYLKSAKIEHWPQSILNTVDYTKVRSMKNADDESGIEAPQGSGYAKIR